MMFVHKDQIKNSLWEQLIIVENDRLRVKC